MEHIEQTKRCKICQHDLLLDRFHTHAGGRFGRRSHCKGCRSLAKLAKRRIAKPVVLPVSSETERAWAAGIVEGEGCIIITKSTSGFGMALSVANTDLYMLAELKRLFGGYFNAHGCAVANRKAQWQWNIHGKLAVAVLRLLLPFMKTTKKKQAEFAIEYGDRFSNYPGLRKRNEERRAEQDWYYRRLRELKHELPSLSTVEV